jgi:hypothetical protein
LSNITPSKLSELYKEKKINKSEFLQRIVTIYEFSDSEKVRIDCLNSLDTVNISDEKLFKFLEEIIISEINLEIRINAMTIILNKFPEKAFELSDYLFTSSDSKEFIMKIAKKIGETLIKSEEPFKDKFSELLKVKIIDIFKNEDVRSFEILWGDWCYNTPENYWDFLLDLKSPIGFLELLDYFIDNQKIYYWFYQFLLEKFIFDQWIIFLKNSRFSGRLLYILFYLEEEKPPNRFYQIINLFEHIGKELTEAQINEIIDILKKGNQYDLAIILIFRWLDNFNDDSLKKILVDTKINLISKLNSLVINNQFDFLNHDHLIYSLLSFLVKISKNIDENYLIQFINPGSPRIIEELSPILNKFLRNSQKTKKPKIEKEFLFKYKAMTLEFIKILSKYFDIKLINS